MPPVSRPRTKAKPRPKPADRNLKRETDTEPKQKRDDDPFYCPGCGKRFKFLAECHGQTPAAPHPAILVVSTDELDGDPANHTAAPASE